MPHFSINNKSPFPLFERMGSSVDTLAGTVSFDQKAS